MLCIHFEGRINKNFKTENEEKRRKIRLLFGLRNWKDRLAMEKIKEERLVYLLV